MEKVIVTGGAGFIGSHIVDALLRAGYEVHVIDNFSSGKKENLNPKAVLHTADIREMEKLLPIFEGAEYVFHEAALPQVQYSIENPIETNEINVKGMLNVLEASRIHKIKKVIFASSCSVYGNQETLPMGEVAPVNPLSPYGAQKLIGEIYMKLYSQIYGLATVSLRYFNVYGLRQSASRAYASVIPKFIEARTQNKPLSITGDGEQTRDFVNIRDLVEANLLAMKSGKVGKGEVINIGSGRRYSVNQIAKLMGGPVSFMPPRIELRDAEAEISKAKELLDWEPAVKIEDGIAELKKTFNI